MIFLSFLGSRLVTLEYVAYGNLLTFFSSPYVLQENGRVPWNCCRRRKPFMWRARLYWIGSRNWKTAATYRFRSWALPVHHLPDYCENVPATRPLVRCSRRRRRSYSQPPWRRPVAGLRVTNKTDVSHQRDP